MEQTLTLITGNPKPKVNIRTYLLVLQGIQPALNGDPLLKLSKCRLIEFSLELGLAHQNNLEELFLIGLQIREKS